MIVHRPMHLMLFHTPSTAKPPRIRHRPVFLAATRKVTRLSGDKVSRYNRHRSHTASRSGSPPPSHAPSESTEGSDGRDDECDYEDDDGDDSAVGERAVCAVCMARCVFRGSGQGGSTYVLVVTGRRGVDPVESRAIEAGFRAIQRKSFREAL